MIKILNVSKKFKDKMILENISLEIKKGECLALIGSNGSGKSVLLSLIAGLMSPSEGKIIVRGQELGKNIDFPDNMGVLINEPGYVGFYTGYKNLYYLSLINGKIGEKEIRKTMEKLNLDPDNKTLVSKYSLGMKQKLGIAQAIMEDQDLLILDEPFNALDHKTYRDIYLTLKDCKSEGKTIIMTSHDFSVLEDLADRIFIIDQGRLLPLTEELKEEYFKI